MMLWRPHPPGERRGKMGRRRRRRRERRGRWRGSLTVLSLSPHSTLDHCPPSTIAPPTPPPPPSSTTNTR